MDTIVSIFSVILAAISLALSYQNSQKQARLADRLQRQDQDFEKKRLVITLWDKMANVAEIQPDKQNQYNENDIFEALNTLELVAICWKYELVDRNMIALAFGNSYAIRVQEILNIDKSLKVLRRTGPELLQNRSSILDVKNKIQNQLGNRY